MDFQAPNAARAHERRAPRDADCSRALALVRLRIEGLRLGEIGVRALQELCFGLLVAEAVGLALDVALTEQSVFTSLLLARPSVHILLNSPVTANAAVASPSANAPASADVTNVLFTWAANKTRGWCRPFPIPRPPQ